MKILSANIPTSLGDLINIKAYLDQVKHEYSSINLTYHTSLWSEALHINKDQERMWLQYLQDISNLFFSEPPYKINKGQFRFYDTIALTRAFHLTPIKPEMGHLLCKGDSLNLGEEYVVITTKIRGVDRNRFLKSSIQLWSTLRKLSQKYKIVILGEREVEMRKEYKAAEVHNTIFGIYEQIVSNIPLDRIIDLTVPALGNTPSNLKQIQQDCLIMKEAKCCITIGIGGNFCMSTSVANMSIGWREDNIWLTDMIFGSREYPNAIITKNWNKFLNVLEQL